MDKKKSEGTKRSSEQSRRQNSGTIGTPGMSSNVLSNAGIEETKRINEKARKNKGTSTTPDMS